MQAGWAVGAGMVAGRQQAGGKGASPILGHTTKGEHKAGAQGKSGKGWEHQPRHMGKGGNGGAGSEQIIQGKAIPGQARMVPQGEGNLSLARVGTGRQSRQASGAGTQAGRTGKVGGPGGAGSEG